MTSLFKQKISAHVALYVFIASITALTVFGIINYFVTQKNQLNLAQNSIKQLVTIINDTASIAAYLDNEELAQDVVNGLINHDLIAGATISSQRGLNKTAGRNSNSSIQTYVLYSPFEDEMIGQLIISPNLDFIKQQTTQSIYSQVIYLVSYTILMIILIMALMNFSILKPVKNIIGQLKRIKPGDHKQIEEQSNHHENEIGYLISYINSLLKTMDDKLAEEQERLIRSELLNIDLQTAHDEIKVSQSIAEQSKLEAIKANQAKSDFLANMSHELRTPMHGILSYAAMGIKRVEKSDAEKNLRYFSNIKLSAERLMILLNDLLDLAKLEAGKMDMSFIKSSLPQISAICVGELQAKLDELSLQIKYGEDSIEGIGFFDGPKIGQVITNFLSNAIKFSPENSTIDINILETELLTNEKKRLNAFLFSVRDHGNGIPEGEFELVFDKFAQSSDTAVGTTKGTGLGLPISKEIIELHQGKIWAENHPNGGAIFTFIIPQTANEEKETN